MNEMAWCDDSVLIHRRHGIDAPVPARIGLCHHVRSGIALEFELLSHSPYTTLDNDSLACCLFRF